MSNIPVTIETLKSNGGLRSITRAILPAGAKAVRHYHTQYTERFKVIQGELIVIKSGKKYSVRAGESSPSINTMEVHYFKNESADAVTVDIILQPGHQGCETSNLIFSALARENKLALFSKTFSFFMIAFYEITNTIPVGITGAVYSVIKIFGKRRIENWKVYLLKLI
jgi:quercetin dioxygenase-like cupin family protein